MEPEILWTRRGHRSRVAIARRFRNGEHLIELNTLYPERFEYDHSSPSQVFINNVGFMTSEGFRRGIAEAAVKQKHRIKRQERIEAGKIRSFDRLTSRTLLQHKARKDDEAKLHARSRLWRDRREDKQWQIEAAYYDSFDA